VVDKHGVEVLHVRQADKLVHRGVVADISFQPGVGLAPLLRRHAEHGHVQYVGLVGVDDARLRRRHFVGDDVALDCVRVDAVVYLRQLALGRPSELRLLLGLKALELANEIDLELWADPHGELKGDVLVGECPSIAARLGDDAHGVGLLHPLLRAEAVAVQPGLAFNYVEFGTIKTGIVHLLPNAEKLNRVAVAQPVGEEEVAVLRSKHVGWADIVLVLHPYHRHGYVFYGYLRHKYSSSVVLSLAKVLIFTDNAMITACFVSTSIVCCRFLTSNAP